MSVGRSDVARVCVITGVLSGRTPRPTFGAPHNYCVICRNWQGAYARTVPFCPLSVVEITQSANAGRTFLQSIVGGNCLAGSLPEYVHVVGPHLRSEGVNCL